MSRVVGRPSARATLITELFASLGQMALTNYLTESVVLGVIFLWLLQARLSLVLEILLTFVAQASDLLADITT
jgi:uncharacterized membrane protein YeiB